MPQEQPLVSIIVPIYNAKNHIARCVESIRRQTYRNLEILLLNDGSEDVSLQVCQMYAGVDDRIDLLTAMKSDDLQNQFYADGAALAHNLDEGAMKTYSASKIKKNV